MSKSYIPQYTYIVCTYQLNSGPQKLIATRSKTSVFHKGEPLLTKQDKNTAAPFTCKSPAQSALSFFGLWAGLFLASNPIGWAVIGVGALILAAGIAVAIAASHPCTSCLSSGNWMNYKSDVKFNGYPAITQASMLICSKGGCLQPIISYDVATQTAQAIATNNLIESGIVTVGAVASGYLMGKGGGIVKKLGEVFSKKGILFTVAGVGATYAMTSFEKSCLRRDKKLANNEIYERMNKAEAKDWSEVETYLEETEDIAKDNFLDPADIRDANIMGTINAYNALREVGGDLSKYRGLENMSRQQLRIDPTARALLEDLNSGKYPDIVANARYYNRNRLNPTTRNEAITQLKNEVSKNKMSTIEKAGGFILFFLPLAETFFSERARKDLARYAIQDINNSITVKTMN